MRKFLGVGHLKILIINQGRARQKECKKTGTGKKGRFQGVPEGWEQTNITGCIGE